MQQELEWAWNTYSTSPTSLCRLYHPFKQAWSWYLPEHHGIDQDAQLYIVRYWKLSNHNSRVYLATWLWILKLELCASEYPMRPTPLHFCVAEDSHTSWNLKKGHYITLKTDPSNGVSHILNIIFESYMINNNVILKQSPRLWALNSHKRVEMCCIKISVMWFTAHDSFFVFLTQFSSVIFLQENLSEMYPHLEKRNVSLLIVFNLKLLQNILHVALK